MGSVSDAPHMEKARSVLGEFGVRCEFNVVTPHRTPDEMIHY